MTCGTRMHWRSLLVSTALALGWAARGYSEQTVYDLCIEQSPAKAGKITPGSGTHRVCADSVVTLSAEPQPGYQFACWLGDVVDPSARETTVHVNASKVVVAVFRHADDDPFARRSCGGGGGGMLVQTLVDLSTPSFSCSGGGKTSHTTSTPVIVPIPTPEPSTVLLLAVGALALCRRSRRVLPVAGPRQKRNSA